MAGVFVPQMQQRDTLGEVLKGLQVASTGFGIYKDFQGLQDRQDELTLRKQQGETAQLKAEDDIRRKGEEDAAKAKVAGGYLDVPEQAKLKQSGWRESTAAAPGAVPFTMATPQGEKPAFFLPPQNDQEKTLAAAPGKARDAALVEHDKTKKVSLDLRDRYDRDDTTKMTRSRMNSFAGIEQNFQYEGPRSGVADLSMIYQYNKLLDPGSGVKEGEAMTIEKSASMPDWIRQLYNQKLVDGSKLTDEQRAEIYRESKGLLAAQLKQQEAVDTRYKADSKKYDIHDSSMVIDSTFEQALSEIKKSKPTAVSKNKPIQLPGISGEAHAAPEKSGFDPDSYLQGVR